MSISFQTYYRNLWCTINILNGLNVIYLILLDVAKFDACIIHKTQRSWLVNTYLCQASTSSYVRILCFCILKRFSAGLPITLIVYWFAATGKECEEFSNIEKFSAKCTEIRHECRHSRSNMGTYKITPLYHRLTLLLGVHIAAILTRHCLGQVGGCACVCVYVCACVDSLCVQWFFENTHMHSRTLFLSLSLFRWTQGFIRTDCPRNSTQLENGMCQCNEGFVCVNIQTSTTSTYGCFQDCPSSSTVGKKIPICTSFRVWLFEVQCGVLVCCIL